MSAVDLLKRLSAQGVRVSLDGTDLRVRGLVKVITPELTDELRRLKTEVVELLSENPDLTDVIPRRDGTALERLAYEIRDTRLIAQCRAKAVELQAWLTAHCDEHMKSDYPGLPEWIANMAEFDVIERGQLRELFGFTGCIHDTGSCPVEAPVNCDGCVGASVLQSRRLWMHHA